MLSTVLDLGVFNGMKYLEEKKGVEVSEKKWASDKNVTLDIIRNLVSGKKKWNNLWDVLGGRVRNECQI